MNAPHRDREGAAPTPQRNGPLTAAELREVEERAGLLTDLAESAASRARSLRVSALEVRKNGWPETLVREYESAASMYDEAKEYFEHAREDVPRLLATVKALRELLKQEVLTPWTDREINVALAAFAEQETGP